MTNRIKGILTIAILAAAAFAGYAASPAHASSLYQWCGNPSGTECWDAWFGGLPVKTYPYGDYLNGNNTWYIDQNGTGPCGGYTTSTDCPWPGTPAGLPIVQISSGSTGSCGGNYIGDNGNNPNDAKAACVGYGGWGWNWIEDTAACPSGAALFISIHWSGSWGYARGLQIPGSTGAQLYNNSTPYCNYNM